MKYLLGVTKYGECVVHADSYEEAMKIAKSDIPMHEFNWEGSYVILKLNELKERNVEHE